MTVFRKIFLLSILVLASLYSYAQDDNAERIKAAYMYADSIPSQDTIATPNKSISKFKGIKTKKEQEALDKKKDQRPFLQRVIYPEKHSPLTATAFSLALPGAGQIYNKKYWKLPIVYGGLGWMGYRIVKTTKDHREFRDAYLLRIDGDLMTIDTFPQYSDSGLNTLRLGRKKEQELAIIGFSLVYVLVAVDAFVDAHLWSFDVNDDLSMGLSPTLLSGTNQVPTPGISLSLYTRRPSPSPPLLLFHP